MFEAQRKLRPQGVDIVNANYARVTRSDTPERAGELADRGNELNFRAERVPRDVVVQTRTLRSELQHGGDELRQGEQPADAGALDDALDGPEAAPDPADTALQGPLPPPEPSADREDG